MNCKEGKRERVRQRERKKERRKEKEGKNRGKVWRKVWRGGECVWDSGESKEKGERALGVRQM